MAEPEFPPTLLDQRLERLETVLGELVLRIAELTDEVRKRA
jgi:hypothetical protein